MQAASIIEPTPSDYHGEPTGRRGSAARERAPQSKLRPPSPLQVGRDANYASNSAHPIKDREAARQHVDQILPISRRLPIFAHRYERHIYP